GNTTSKGTSRCRIRRRRRRRRRRWRRASSECVPNGNGGSVHSVLLLKTLTPSEQEIPHRLSLLRHVWRFLRIEGFLIRNLSRFLSGCPSRFLVIILSILWFPVVLNLIQKFPFGLLKL